MAKATALRFFKYQASGNDFIVIADPRFGRTAKPSGSALLKSDSGLRRLARSICARHTGVGGDGLLLILPASHTECDARMRVFNADGSEAEMSGNGIRCAAAYLAMKKRGARTLHIETAAGVKSLDPGPILRKSSVSANRAESGLIRVFRVGMGVPVFEPGRIPFKAPDARFPLVRFPLQTTRGITEVTITSMGNPHCSLFLSDFDALDWADLGREIETHELFPNRTNVEFVRVISRKEIEVRYWERGVGRTKSSGTGSCAAVVASILNGLTDRNVRVNTLGGTLQVSWPQSRTQDNAAEVVLTGPAELIAEGTYYVGGSIS